MRPTLYLFFAAILAVVPGSVLAQEGVLAPRPSEIAPRIVRVTVDEAVAMALENNLGIQVARLGPRMQDLALAQTRAARTPTIDSSFNSSTSNSPNSDFLSGGVSRTTTENLSNSVSLQQTFPWDGNLNASWNSSRTTDNNAFSIFQPQIRSSLNLNYSQSLTRGFIDSTRQQLETGAKGRDIADLDLSETLVNMERRVRGTYWDLAYQIANLDVQRQSYELAQESLRATQARVAAGVLPPVDIVAAEAEVARRENDIINAEAQITATQDQLRILVFDPDMADFWTVRLELSAELPAFQPVAVDIDAAMRNALERRTDIRRTRLSLEREELNLRFARNMARPNVSARFNYSVSAIGGTQLHRGVGALGPGTGDVLNEQQRGFATVLADLFGGERPSWSVGIQVSYPIGTSVQEARLAQSRLEYSQAEVRAREQQTAIAMQVRAVGRQLQNTQRRVEALRRARELSERQLEAEQRRLDAGTGTSFSVFQAQRDLAAAQNGELRAILDYNLLIIDFETVQEVPLR